jgi:hypothetical protein
VRRSVHLLGPLAAALALVPIAVSVKHTSDFGLAYEGGVEAWASGHPERLFPATWTATPFFTAAIAAVTRLASEEPAARIFLGANILLYGALLMAIWHGLHGRVSSRWWWGTLVAAAVFAPAISTIFWLQFNLVALALALAGFVLIGRNELLAGLLIGASVAFKPILLLLPFALLLRRETRSAAVWAIAGAAGLSAIGLGFLAWRAGDLSLLNPVAYAAGFLAHGRGPTIACVPENYSPVALLCRLGLPTGTPVILGVEVAVLTAGWLLMRRFRDLPGRRWETFAAAGVLSPMLGPIGWSHYQILLGPLLLLLAYQFQAGSAPAWLWVSLGVAYILSELVWDPLESFAQTPVPVVVFSYLMSQFAQYFALLTWVRWLRFSGRSESALLDHS